MMNKCHIAKYIIKFILVSYIGLPYAFSPEFGTILLNRRSSTCKLKFICVQRSIEKLI